MLYNVRIFGKRYKNKTVSQIIEIAEKNADNLNLQLFNGLKCVKRDLQRINNDPDIISFKWYNFGGYVCFSINKVKDGII